MSKKAHSNSIMSLVFAWCHRMLLECAVFKRFHVHFGLTRDTLGNCFFLRTEITLKGATYQISFTDTDQLPPPLRIDNTSEVRQCHDSFSHMSSYKATESELLII